jgi:hypothetical protein
MADLLRFHACIYARPATVSRGSEQSLAGCRVTPLAAQQRDLLAAFSITFDAAAAELSRLPRMFFEPDGSFVWVSAADEPAWQIDGLLYDRGPALASVEIKGACPPAALDALMRCFGWQGTPLVFELVREALLLDEADFLRVAAAMT